MKRRLILDFPKSVVEQPITYRLIREYGVQINILRAKITPDEEGRLVIEVEAEKEQLEEALNFLKEVGVKVTPIAQDIVFDEEKCTHCTYCIALCPREAFSVTEEQKVVFDKERCMLCELCAKVCPYDAVQIKF
jgi:ferredoxin